MTQPQAMNSNERDRELEYYRSEHNAIGARLLRLQEEQSRVSREARRSRTIARLVREAYHLIDRNSPAETIGTLMLAKIADASVCDRAVFLRAGSDAPGHFVIEHALGSVRRDRMVLPDPPAFLYTAAGVAIGPESAPMMALLDMRYVLWAFEAAEGRALLLGNKMEGNIHRAFEPDDREFVEVALTVYNDLLARKRAENLLREAKQAAEDANTTRARFLATLSHEFRSPLEAVIGFSELLAQTDARAPNVEERVRFANQIGDSGQRLLALVKDILDFSRFNNVVPILRRDWIPVAQLLRYAVQGFAAQAGSRKVAIALAAPDDTWRICVDYERFRQILSNLIGNAIKFTPESGEIRVEARLTNDGGMEITVRDTGIGIRAEAIERAFEPYVQVHDRTGPRIAGAGLGLPITKQLVEAHDGTIALASTYGEGTVATILLPPDHVRQAGANEDSGKTA